ncbi:MAG: hypothetical protein FD171_2257, partial [Actinobacteria bacterium]
MRPNKCFQPTHARARLNWSRSFAAEAQNRSVRRALGKERTSRGIRVGGGIDVLHRAVTQRAQAASSRVVPGSCWRVAAAPHSVQLAATTGEWSAARTPNKRIQ